MSSPKWHKGKDSCTSNPCMLAKPRKNTTEKKNGKKRRSSTNDLESDSAEFISDEDTIKPCSTAPPNNLGIQTRRHKQMENAKDATKINWLHEVQTSNDYAKNRTEFIIMVSKFESMSDGNLDQTEAAQHRIKLLPEDIRSAHSAPYQGGSKAREFETNEIAEMLEPKAIEPAQSEWVSPMMFEPKRT